MPRITNTKEFCKGFKGSRYVLLQQLKLLLQPLELPLQLQFATSIAISSAITCYYTSTTSFSIKNELCKGSSI